MNSDRLSVALQENLLTLLCFSGTASPQIRTAVTLNLYSNSLYRDIAARCYDFFDEFKKPPGDHLPDLFEQELNGEGADKYGPLVVALREQKEQVNEAYILGQLDKFVRQQSLKTSIVAAAEALQQGDLDEAEKCFQEGLRQRITTFSPGTRLSKGIQKIFNQEVRIDTLPTGITELDKWDLGAARGELHLFMGPPKRGKSWWLVHVAKMGLLARRKVLYITLELSEAQILQRVIQSMFSVQRRKAPAIITKLKVDSMGRIQHWDQATMANRLALEDPATRPVLEKKLARLRVADNFMVKQFPANSLTCREMDNYLEMLEQTEGFIPDVLALDYYDYMKLSASNYRLELGAMLNDIRGMAVTRNIPIYTAKRVNRIGAEADIATGIHAGEDYSAIYTADTIFSYNQTDFEKELGLARIYAADTRVSEKSQFTVLISQAYQVGQFVLGNALMSPTYKGQLEQASMDNGGGTAPDAV